MHDGGFGDITLTRYGLAVWQAIFHMLPFEIIFYGVYWPNFSFLPVSLQFYVVRTYTLFMFMISYDQMLTKLVESTHMFDSHLQTIDDFPPEHPTKNEIKFQSF